MNAHLPKKMRLMTTALASAPLALAVASCALTPRTDPVSPIAPRVQELVDANRHYPRWENFPKASTDLPDPAQIALQARTLEGQGGTLHSEVARIDWTLGDAEAMAAETRAQVGAVPVSPDAARTEAEIDAFAQALRDRAKAPPPIDRRPVQ